MIWFRNLGRSALGNGTRLLPAKLLQSFSSITFSTKRSSIFLPFIDGIKIGFYLWSVFRGNVCTATKRSEVVLCCSLFSFSSSRLFIIIISSEFAFDLSIPLFFVFITSISSTPFRIISLRALEIWRGRRKRKPNLQPVLRQRGPWLCNKMPSRLRRRRRRLPRGSELALANG